MELPIIPAAEHQKGAKRRCLVGLSTPIGYFWGYVLEINRPNAILEAPMGLFFLYDEIWFLHRRLCPYNMEHLDYVHFVDEEYDLGFLDETVLRKCGELESAFKLPREIQFPDLISQHSPVFRHVRSAGENLTLRTQVQIKPGCLRVRNHLADRIVADTLGFDLVSNSIFADAVKPKIASSHRAALAQRLICPEFSNFQGVDGPYMELIEDFRSDAAVKSFREKISGTDVSNAESLQGVVAGLEEEMRRAGERLIQSASSPIRLYKGVASAIFGQVPVVSTVFGGLEALHGIYAAIKDKREMAWMAFVSRAKGIPVNMVNQDRRHKHA